MEPDAITAGIALMMLNVFVDLAKRELDIFAITSPGLAAHRDSLIQLAAIVAGIGTYYVAGQALDGAGWAQLITAGFTVAFGGGAVNSLRKRVEAPSEPIPEPELVLEPVSEV